MQAALNSSARAPRTRAALLAAGLKLVSERPVDAISIDEIVTAAGVAKGSFFNHFRDKAAFATALGEQVRREIEGWVAQANDGVNDPLERLVGGMTAAAAFALREPQQVVVLARTSELMVLQSHPLNAGVARDIRGAATSGGLSQTGSRRGVLFWLGCCQTLMNAIVGESASAQDASTLLRDMVRLGLIGLGAPSDRIEDLAVLQDLSAW